MQAPGYFLYIPPTPIKARFVMVEESTQTFYDVNAVLPELRNPSSWASSGLSRDILGDRPAIVIDRPLDTRMRNEIAARGGNPDFAVAKLVSIQEQDGDEIHAQILGKVNIVPYPPNVMSWDILEKTKKQVLADEVRNGLLGKLWGGLNPERPFIHPEKLANMPRNWHVDPAALNLELDGVFASGLIINNGDVEWYLR